MLAGRMIQWKCVLCDGEDDRITRAAYAIRIWISMEKYLLNRVELLVIRQRLEPLWLIQMRVLDCPIRPSGLLYELCG